MFKLGVMATIVKIILLLSLKAVFIGKLLLFINVGFIIAKIVAWKTQESHHTGWQQPQWSGPPWQTHSWYPSAPPIHVHIHSDNKEHHEPPHYSDHSNQPYPHYTNPNSLSGPYDRLDIGPVSKKYDQQRDPLSPSYYGRS